MSTPGISTSRTCPVSSFFCRKGMEASSAAEGYKMLMGRSAHTASLASRSRVRLILVFQVSIRPRTSCSRAERSACLACSLASSAAC